MGAFKQRSEAVYLASVKEAAEAGAGWQRGYFQSLAHNLSTQVTDTDAYGMAVALLLSKSASRHSRREYQRNVVESAVKQYVIAYSARKMSDWDYHRTEAVDLESAINDLLSCIDKQNVGKVFFCVAGAWRGKERVL